MSTVRLEFDLDSDVYPELYEALAPLGSARSRAERMRQLAASGLVWENVRIYGASAIGPTTLTAEKPVPAAPPPLAAPPPARAPRAATPSERSRASRPRAAPETPAHAADFVDLAIDALPAEVAAGPAADERRALRISQSDVEAVARELPVLMDIVTDTAASGEPVEARMPPPLTVVPTLAAAIAPAEPIPQAVPPAAEGQAAEEVRGESPAVAADDEVIHLTALAQKPATRSRLMRMKEKGLFKNG
jgi:hypothetical protein